MGKVLERLRKRSERIQEDRGPALRFSGDATEYLWAVLHHEFVVQITMRSGERFDAEMVGDSHTTTDDGTYALWVRRWFDETGQRKGEPEVISVEDVAEVYLY